MRNLYKLIGFAALVAVIGFSMAGCGGEPAHTHDWGAWTETKSATCIATGSQTRTCALDATHTETEVIPVNDDHDYGDWTGVTCTTAGEGTRVCSRNAGHTETKQLDALGHDYQNYTQTTAPTCTDEGEETGTCTRDQATTTRAVAINPAAHNWEQSEGTAPTCTANGNGVQICSYNNEHIQSGVLLALGHDYQNYTQTTAPTCTTAGVETGTCTHDSNHTTTRAGAVALGHDYQNYTQTTAPTCTTAGVETGTCIRDQVTATRAIAIVSTAHNWNNSYTIKTPATCTATGIETDTCSINPSHTRTQTVAIDPNAHNWNNSYIITTPATCTETGIETDACSLNASHTREQTVAINPNAHDYGQVLTTTATATQSGTETGACRRDETHTYTRNNVLAPMVFVPGGTFDMGKDLGTAATGDVTPVHTVTLSGFHIGKYEVTQAQWQAVMGSLPSGLTSGTYNFGRSDDRPIYFVNWYDALVFCNKLSISEGLTPAYRINGSTDPSAWGTVPNSTATTWNNATVVSGSTGYRLPTEAQWEYAAKGGDPTAAGWVGYTYAGSNIVGDVAWYDGNNGSLGSSTYGSKAVGTKAANRLGIYDMSGNVREWCWDRYGDYTSEAQTDPTGASLGNNRASRDGTWGHGTTYLRSVDRGSSSPDNRIQNLGFRLARPAN